MTEVRGVPADLAGRGIVLIGAGRMGLAHGRALATLGVPLTAVCDSRPEALERAARELALGPEVARFGDPDRLFDTLRAPGLVVVATTADVHCEMVCRAARARADVLLCEKPMATSVEDCDRILSACADSGTRLAVNHQMRFMPQYTTIQEELRSGRFGALASMNVVAGCFGVAMNGSHYVEAFRFLTDSPPRSVTAWFSPEKLPNPRGARFLDQAGELRVVSEAGQRLHLEIGSDQGHGMTVTYATRWGHIFVDELAGEYVATARQAEARSEPVTRYGMPWDRWRASFPPPDNVAPTAAVMAALLAGEGYPSGEDGRAVCAVLAAAYLSASEGNREVAVADIGDFATRRFPWA